MAWIALVGPEIEENLSLRYCAASLEAAGYRCEILPFHEDGHFAGYFPGPLYDEALKIREPAHPNATLRDVVLPPPLRIDLDVVDLLLEERQAER